MQQQMFANFVVALLVAGAYPNKVLGFGNRDKVPVHAVFASL
jgi:hypothetical protein